MYTAIRHYRIGRGSVEEVMEMVEKEFADRIPREVGAISYSALDLGDGTVATITTFPDELSFQRATRTVSQVQAAFGARYQVQEILMMHGEVPVHRGSTELAQPVHYAGRV